MTAFVTTTQAARARDVVRAMAIVRDRARQPVQDAVRAKDSARVCTTDTARDRERQPATARVVITAKARHSVMPTTTVCAITLPHQLQRNRDYHH